MPTISRIVRGLVECRDKTHAPCFVGVTKTSMAIRETTAASDRWNGSAHVIINSGLTRGLICRLPPALDRANKKATAKPDLCRNKGNPDSNKSLFRE